MKQPKITNAQFALARKFEAAGLTTISQAVKAFERNETSKVKEWESQLAAKAKFAAMTIEEQAEIRIGYDEDSE